MSRNKERDSKESFLEKLGRLRLKIDLLPAQQQPHLKALADTIEQQRRRLEKNEYQDDPAS